MEDINDQIVVHNGGRFPIKSILFDLDEDKFLVVVLSDMLTNGGKSSVLIPRFMAEKLRDKLLSLYPPKKKTNNRKEEEPPEKVMYKAAKAYCVAEFDYDQNYYINEQAREDHIDNDARDTMQEDWFIETVRAVWKES